MESGARTFLPDALNDPTRGLRFAPTTWLTSATASRWRRTVPIVPRVAGWRPESFGLCPAYPGGGPNRSDRAPHRRVAARTVPIVTRRRRVAARTVRIATRVVGWPPEPFRSLPGIVGWPSNRSDRYPRRRVAARAVRIATHAAGRRPEPSRSGPRWGGRSGTRFWRPSGLPPLPYFRFPGICRLPWWSTRPVTAPSAPFWNSTWASTTLKKNEVADSGKSSAFF